MNYVSIDVIKKEKVMYGQDDNSVAQKGVNLCEIREKM